MLNSQKDEFSRCLVLCLKGISLKNEAAEEGLRWNPVNSN
jgi:hypothetical protein